MNQPAPTKQEVPPTWAMPSFVTTREEARRYRLCRKRAMEVFEANADVMLFAEWLFFSDIPTGGMPV